MRRIFHNSRRNEDGDKTYLVWEDLSQKSRVWNYFIIPLAYAFLVQQILSMTKAVLELVQANRELKDAQLNRYIEETFGNPNEGQDDKDSFGQWAGETVRDYENARQFPGPHMQTTMVPPSDDAS